MQKPIMFSAKSIILNTNFNDLNGNRYLSALLKTCPCRGIVHSPLRLHQFFAADFLQKRQTPTLLSATDH